MNIITPMKKIARPILDIFQADKGLQEVNRNRSDLNLQGLWTLDHLRDGHLLHTQTGKNLFTTEGMNYLLDIIFNDTSKAASEIWYLGLFKGNVTPAAGDTGAAALGSGGTYTECQDPADFDNAATVGGDTASTGNKPLYSPAAAASAIVTNTAAQCQFTMNGSITVYGAFLSNVADCATPGSAVLMCAKKFGTARTVIADDVLAVTVQITASSS